MIDEYNPDTITAKAEALATLAATSNDVVDPVVVEHMNEMMALLVDSVRKEVHPSPEAPTEGNVVYPRFNRYRHDNDNGPKDAA